jgi:hypothetical protein
MAAMKHDRRIPAWLLRDIPALAGMFACFWLFILPLIAEGWRLIRGGEPRPEKMQRIAHLLLNAEATIAFALWREKGAAHMSGQMASIGDAVYAGMGVWLTDPTGPYDASRYSGVTFWAKGPGRVRFEIPDVHTGPEGGICKDCYNDFGIVLALESEWRKYTIRFEWLEQRSGWGEPYPALQTDQILKLEWEFNGKGRAYDIWVDDIAFVCEGSTP